jgi:hypothetical protein
MDLLVKKEITKVPIHRRLSLPTMRDGAEAILG